MVTVTKEYQIIKAIGYPNPAISLGDFYLTIEGVTKPLNQKQSVYVGQPFWVLYKWACVPLAGYRAKITLTVEVKKNGVIKYTLPPVYYTPADSYSKWEQVYFLYGVDEEGDWSIRVVMSAETIV